MKYLLSDCTTGYVLHVGISYVPFKKLEHNNAEATLTYSIRQ